MADETSMADQTGLDAAANAGGGMGDVMSGLGLAGDIIGFGFGEHGRKQARKARKKALQDWERRTNDLGYRREATYRAERGRINTAIESFYKARGWELPEKKPGAYTTRPLPGEDALYPEDQFTYPSKDGKGSEKQDAAEIVGGLPAMQEEPEVQTSEGEMEDMDTEDTVGDLSPEAPDMNVVDEEMKNRAAFTAPANVGAQPGGQIQTPEVDIEPSAQGKQIVAVNPQEYEALQLLRKRQY